MKQEEKNIQYRRVEILCVIYSYVYIFDVVVEILVAVPRLHRTYIYNCELSMCRKNDRALA